MSIRAVIFDRDGVLIEDSGYPHRSEYLRWMPGAVEAIAALNRADILVLVATNQSGIARGYYDEATMHRFHELMQFDLARSDAEIDAFYFCPHLPCDGCACRKPGLGMIESSSRDFEIDMSGSWMFGDKRIDVETGRNAGIKSAMVMTGYGRAHSKQLEYSPDVMAEDLLAAVQAALQ